MAKLVNLTPHEIVVQIGDTTVNIPASGTSARISTMHEHSHFVEGVPVLKNIYGAIEGLPDPEEDTIFIVSLICLSHAAGRTDIVAPDTGATAIRNNNGLIQAVRGFIQVPQVACGNCGFVGPWKNVAAR